MKRRVIIESPYAGDVDANVAYARQCVRDAVLRGEAPIASHLLFTQPGILRDEIADERKLGIDCGLAWLVAANVVAVYVDRGISNGMRAAMDAAALVGPAIEMRKILCPHGFADQAACPTCQHFTTVRAADK